MKKLVKIKLINWHLFNNETIRINNNTLVTGENATGKSTLLDAIQYVLTAGDNTKFNTAANKGNKRSLETYIKGKLGIENKEYIRTNDVVTHIALEYYDEKTNSYQVLGVVLTLNKGNSNPKKNFYQLINTRIKEQYYIEDTKVNDWLNFKSSIKQSNIDINFKDNSRDAKTLFKTALGVSTKYFDLIPKALAFKPIDKLDDFIYGFLLDKKDVDIAALRDTIREYNELEKSLKHKQDIFKILEKIVKANDKYNNLLLDESIYTYIRNNMTIDNNKVIIDKYDRTLKENNNNINENNSKLATNNNKLNDINTVITNINVDLNNNDTYKAIETLNNNKRTKENELNIATVEYNNYNKELNTNIELIKKANIKSKIDINDLSTSLYNVEIEVKSTLSNLNEVYYKTKEDKRNIEFELSNKEKELKKLKSNKLSYSDSVNDLINLLKTELESKYNKTIEVKPLCEYLKVLDPSWRNALEGYFNTQKFDIIVEPQYFDEATLLYKQYKDNLGIYDVGIVNVNKIMNDTKNKSIANDSLANKLEVSNDYAKSYVNYLLGNVICVNDISELKKHHIAITKECMVNKNYTIRAIHPRIYQKPFIGHDAIEIQIVALEATVDTLKTKLLKTNEDYEESKYKRELLMETNINTLISNTNKVTNYINIKIELDDITSRLNNLVVDPSVITLQEQLKSKEEERKQIDITIRQLEIKNHDLSNSNEQATKAITTIDEKLKELNEYKKTKTIELSASYNDIKRRTDEYLKDYLFNYSKILEEISIKISNINNNKSSYKFNVTQHMDEYNNLTNEGISSDLSSINLYISNYNKLKDIELSDFTNKAQQAKKKCEDSFQTSFISNLKTRIEDANAEIYDLNKSLKQNTFNGDTYEFVIKASSNSTYKDYYNIIMSKEDYNMQDLFMETLSEKNRIVMQELFDQIVNKEDSKDNQDKLEKYTDYRNYLSYDIKITHSNGDITMFSKVSSEKSGGETQIPYYVIIASSFQQIIKNNKRNDAGCLVLFDEAFNNMDESRIKTMMQFYKELSIQVMIAVPPERVPAIRPYIDQTLTVIKQNKQVMVREFNDETI